MAKAQASKKASSNSSKSSQNDNRPMAMSKIAEEDENKSQEQEEEINSGFGSYLRSGEGQSIGVVQRCTSFSPNLNADLHPIKMKEKQISYKWMPTILFAIGKSIQSLRIEISTAASFILI